MSTATRLSPRRRPPPALPTRASPRRPAPPAVNDEPEAVSRDVHPDELNPEIGYLRYAKESGRKIYLPVDFLPIDRATETLVQEKHTTDENARFWRARYDKTMGTDGARAITSDDMYACFTGQLKIRKELRLITTSYLKDLYVQLAVAEGFKTESNQAVATFDDVVDACNRLQDNEKPGKEGERLRLKAFELKYHGHFVKDKWSLHLTARILEEHNVVMRDEKQLQIGKQKSAFVKILSQSLTNLRSYRFCSKLIKRETRGRKTVKNKKGDLVEVPIRS